MGIFGGLLGNARGKSFFDMTGMSPAEEAELRRQMEAQQATSPPSGKAGLGYDQQYQDPFMEAKGSFGGLMGKAGPYNALASAPRMDPSQPQAINPRLLDMIGSAPKKRNNTLPTIAAALGAIASGFQYAEGDERGGDRTMASMSAALNKRRQDYDTKLAEYERRKQIASLPGMNERELAAFMVNPSAWGSNMSDAMSTRQAAANVGQTETRVYGDPNNGGTIYQPPRLIENGVDTIRYDPRTGTTAPVYQGMTQGEQYARSLGKQPGEPAWGAAIQDQQLGANGPTAMEARQALEGIRQGNRVQLRGMPQARLPAPQRADPSPTPSRVMGRIMEKMARGEPLAAGEQKLFDRQGNRGSGVPSGSAPRSGRGMSPLSAPPGSGSSREGEIRLNPKTGQRIQLRGNQWVPLR